MLSDFANLVCNEFKQFIADYFYDGIVQDDSMQDDDNKQDDTIQEDNLPDEVMQDVIMHYPEKQNST